MIRPGPEKHGVWPNLSLDNALLILEMNEYIVLLNPENEQSATLIEALAVASEEYRRIFINAVAIYSDKNIGLIDKAKSAFREVWMKL